jgi:hypothetical protein
MGRKRQLQLPGTMRRSAPPPARARRDLKADEFARALARNGFGRAGDLHFFDATAERRRYIEAECRVNPIRIARRATLAKLIRSRGDA